jgi:glycosyltransferase involved in cell wall biosynthesis
MAYGLARFLGRRHVVHLPVVRGFQPLDVGVVGESVYTRRTVDLAQKARLMRYLLWGVSDADLIHFFFAPTRLSATWASLVARLRSAPTVLTVTHVPLPGARPFVFGQRVVAYSAFMAERLRQVGVENVIHIPPGVDCNAVHPAIDGRREGAKLDIPPQARVVLYGGEYSRSATIDALLEAANICQHAIPDVYFVFACRIRSRDERRRQIEVAARIQALGLGNHLLLLETVPHMHALLARADVCILPLRNTYGKLDIPISLHEVGAAVPVDDGPELARAIENLLSDGTRRGARGRQIVEERYSLDQIARRYESLYKELLA